MTLTAMTEAKELFNPSVMIDITGDRLTVVQTARRRQKDGLYCPHCYTRTGNLIPVHFRNTESKKVHFFHLNDGDSDGAKECSSHSGESEKHASAKAAIVERLKVEGFLEVKTEVKLQYMPGLPWRRPDITVTEDFGFTAVHEVQISPINSQELAARTNDLKKNGADKVFWYFYGKNYNEENRVWCSRNNIGCYHLWFADSDEAKPRWEVDKGIVTQKKTSKASGSSNDRCDRSSVLADRKDSVVVPFAKPAPTGEPIDFLRRRIEFTPSQPVRYVGKTYEQHYSGMLLKVLRVAHGKVTCVMPDGYYTTWLPPEDLEPASSEKIAHQGATP